MTVSKVRDAQYSVFTGALVQGLPNFIGTGFEKNTSLSAVGARTSCSDSRVVYQKASGQQEMRDWCVKF